MCCGGRESDYFEGFADERSVMEMASSEVSFKGTAYGDQNEGGRVSMAASESSGAGIGNSGYFVHFPATFRPVL